MRRRPGWNFEPLATTDFLERFAFACCDRWGLVIEMLIEAFTHCRIVGDKVCSVEHFSHAYAQIYSTPLGYSPFTMPNYRDSFERENSWKCSSAPGDASRTSKNQGPLHAGLFLPVENRGAHGYCPGAQAYDLAVQRAL